MTSAPPPPPGPPAGEPAAGWPASASAASPPPGPYGAPPAGPAGARRGCLLAALAAVAVVVLAVVGAAVAAFAMRDRTRSDRPSDLAIGDCAEVRRRPGGRVTIREVPCSRPHTDEVAGSFVVQRSRFSSTVLEQQARDRCPALVRSFYGARTPEPTTQVAFLGPTEDQWRDGERTVVCSLVEPGRTRRTGSYRA